MTLARKALAVFVSLHAAGATFAIAQYLFFPEAVVDLVPDDVALDKVRYALALLAVLPATFVAWDVALLRALRTGDRRGLLVGIISGGAAILGAAIHAAFQQWSTMALDGSMGATFLGLTAWASRNWLPATAKPTAEPL
jgi:hypothetical protein